MEAIKLAGVFLDILHMILCIYAIYICDIYVIKSQSNYENVHLLMETIEHFVFFLYHGILDMLYVIECLHVIYTFKSFFCGMYIIIYIMSLYIINIIIYIIVFIVDIRI